MNLVVVALFAALLAPESDVALRLKDGTIVTGKTRLGAFKLATTRGPAVFKLPAIRRIGFGDTTTVVTVKDKSFEGRPAIRSLTLKTKGGAKRYALSDLRWLDVIRRAPLVPGKITQGVSGNGLIYHVRVPKSYRKGTPQPTILVFHGSNMCASAYVNTIAAAWPDIGRDYVLVGISGENRHDKSNPESPAYNYSYTGWRGANSDGGDNGARESPPLIMAALKEIQAFLPMERVLVGGHSQGGYLTYTMYMHFPEEFAGAFPVSCGLIVQAEPTDFSKKKVRAAQRAVPLAIVHGENDGVVAFSMAESAYDSFLDDDHPRVRLFTHPRAAHMFAVLPVGAAIRWLEVMAGDDVAALVKLSEQRRKAKDYRGAIAAAQRAAEVSDGKTPARAQAVLDRLEKQATAAARPLKKAMARRTNVWVEPFYEFRNQYAFTEAAQPLMKVFARLRKAHQKPGAKLFWSARADFQRQNKADGYKKCEQIVARYYACSFYKIAKSWLAGRGK